MPFQLSSCDVIGFDLDMTLCRYKMSPFIRLCYQSIASHLVKNLSYPAELLEEFTNDEMQMLAKYQIIEWKTEGNINVFFVAPDGTISHSVETIQKGVKRVSHQWAHVDTFAKRSVWENDGETHQHWAVDSIWDQYLPVLIVRLNQMRNDGLFHKANYQIITDILQAQKYEMSDSIDFASDSRMYYKSIRNDPLKYISPLPQIAIDWLRNLGKSKKLFLMTSSHHDYAKFVLDIIMVENGKPVNYWEIFDLCVADARKPGFFNKRKMFTTIKNEPVVEVRKGDW